jgi:replicative DNA helicase
VEKILPQSPEAEAGVLGSCLIDLEVVASLLAILKPVMFYRRAHRYVWEVIVDLFHAGRAPDLITICDELERRGWLEEVGGIANVSALANNVPSSANAEYYALIVREKWEARETIQAMADAAAMAYTGTPHAKLMAAHMERLAKIGGGASLTPKDFAEVLDEMWEEVQETAFSDIPPGVYTGLPDLDRHTAGFRKKEMIVLAGRPGTFKSTVGAAFCVAEALRQAELRAAGKPWGTVLWLSFEMGRTAQAKRIIAAHARIDSRRIRAGFRMPDGTLRKHEMDRFEAKYRELRGRLAGVLKILDVPLSLSAIRSVCLREAAEGNLQALFLDQFDLMEPEEWAAERRQAELERLNSYARGLKQLAHTLEITAFILVQLNRDSVKETRPGLHNLAGTDRLGRDADAVIMTHYDEGDGTDELRRRFLELNLVKMRDGKGGVCFGAEIEPRYTLLGPWSLGDESTWPEDPTRKLTAPKRRADDEADEREPAPALAGYGQGAF